MTEVLSAYKAFDLDADEARAKTVLRGGSVMKIWLGRDKQIGRWSGGEGKAFVHTPRHFLLLDDI